MILCPVHITRDLGSFWAANWDAYELASQIRILDHNHLSWFLHDYRAKNQYVYCLNLYQSHFPGLLIYLERNIPSALHIAPVSKYLNPNFSASNLAVVPLPLPAGQSMVMVMGLFMVFLARFRSGKTALGNSFSKKQDEKPRRIMTFPEVRLFFRMESAIFCSLKSDNSESIKSYNSGTFSSLSYSLTIYCFPGFYSRICFCLSRIRSSIWGSCRYTIDIYTIINSENRNILRYCPLIRFLSSQMDNYSIYLEYLQGLFRCQSDQDWVILILLPTLKMQLDLHGVFR